MSESTAYDRAVARIDPAAAGIEREDRLDGHFPRIPKSEPESYGTGTEGAREAARNISDRRLHPVSEQLKESKPDGVREIKILGPDGNTADPKATLRQSDLRRVAHDLADDRKLNEADERERYRAFEEGRDYNAAVALEDYAIDAGRRLYGDLTTEQLEALRVADPEKYQYAIQLRDRYQLSQDALREQQQPAEQPQPTEAERQAHEQAQNEARVQAEQYRVAYEAARTHLTQEYQQAQNSRVQVWEIAKAEFPGLARGMSEAQVRQELVQSGNQAALARFDQLNQAAAGVAQRQAEIWQTAAEIDARSGVAQQQQFETFKKVESEKFDRAHPEYRDPVKSAHLRAELMEYLTKDKNIPMEQLRWHYENNPNFHSAEFQEILHDAVQNRKAQKEMANINEHLKKLPPVQKPGVGGYRGGREEEIGRLSHRLDQTGSIRDGVKLLLAKRAAKRR